MTTVNGGGVNFSLFCNNGFAMHDIVGISTLVPMTASICDKL